MGPDDHNKGLNWFLDGSPGDVFEIRFQRSLSFELDSKGEVKVSWNKVREEALSSDELVRAKAPRFCIAGSWSDWKGYTDMFFDGTCYKFWIALGSSGIASFKILKE